MATDSLLKTSNTKVAGSVRAKWRGSVRFKVAIAASSIATFSLLFVGSALVLLVHRSLVDSVSSALQREVALTATGITEGFIPGESSALSGTVVQALSTSGGDVLYASSGISGTARISNDQPVSTSVVPVAISPAFAAQNDFNLAFGATTASTRFGAIIVYAAGSTAQADAATRILVIELGVLVLPSVALLTALISWWVVGRSLRPVEAIRREVAEISTAASGQRVPTPKGDDEIARLATTMNAMLDRLESASNQQRQFVADASHELRSPLASIMVQVQMLETRAKDESVQATAKILADEASRLDRLVDDLLLLAKSDEHALVLEQRDVDLDDLLLSEAKRLRQIGRVEVNAKAVSPVRVTGDPELLRRAIRNLVDNAERYASSTVTFQATLTRHDAEIVIADDGKGVPEELRATLFNRFSRGDSSRVRGTGGTGLGLAIVAQIVALHGGTVEIAPTGPGAHFVIRLPVEFDEEHEYYEA